MDFAIKMPLRSLNPGLISDLQVKYPGAVVRIEVETSAEGSLMDEQQFWAVISLLDWGRKRTEAILAPAVEALSHFSVQNIFRFEEMLAEKLFAIDGEQYARPLGWDQAGQGHFSVDVFLYARCCAVANGRSFYEKVRENPASMPKEYTFEPILYLAEKAYRLKTGSDDYDFLPAISYETFCNETAWPSRSGGISHLIKG